MQINKCRWLVFGAILHSLAGTTPATAAVWCPGKVKSLLIGNDGTMQIDWGYGPFQICNINQDMTQPSPGSAIGYKTCQGIYSMAMTAEATGKTFEALLSTANDCSTFTGNGGYPGQAIGVYNLLQ